MKRERPRSAGRNPSCESCGEAGASGLGRTGEVWCLGCPERAEAAVGHQDLLDAVALALYEGGWYRILLANQTLATWPSPDWGAVQYVRLWLERAEANATALDWMGRPRSAQELRFMCRATATELAGVDQVAADE